MFESRRLRESDASHSLWPAAIRPPKALGFPTQLPGEVLMAIIYHEKIYSAV